LHDHLKKKNTTKTSQVNLTAMIVSCDRVFRTK